MLYTHPTASIKINTDANLPLRALPPPQFTAINSGEYRTQAAGWVGGLDIGDAVGTATTWASESNAAVCTTVLARGLAFVENNDLGGAYTDTAAPVVRLQIAKQGYRYTTLLLFCFSPAYLAVLSLRPALAVELGGKVRLGHRERGRERRRESVCVRE